MVVMGSQVLWLGGLVGGRDNDNGEFGGGMGDNEEFGGTGNDISGELSGIESEFCGEVSQFGGVGCYDEELGVVENDGEVSGEGSEFGGAGLDSTGRCNESNWEEGGMGSDDKEEGGMGSDDREEGGRGSDDREEGGRGSNNGESEAGSDHEEEVTDTDFLVQEAINRILPGTEISLEQCLIG